MVSTVKKRLYELIWRNLGVILKYRMVYNFSQYFGLDKIMKYIPFPLYFKASCIKNIPKLFEIKNFFFFTGVNMNITCIRK